MDSKTLLQLSQEGTSAILKSHLFKALDILDALALECPEQEFFLEAKGMRQLYEQMLQAVSSGQDDASITHTHARLQRDIMLLLYRVHQSLRVLHPEDVYSNTLLKLKGTTPQSLYDQREQTQDNDEKYALQDAIFCLLWVAPMLSTQQSDEWFALISKHDHLHQQYMMSALMLAMLEYPDPAKMLLLIRFIDSPDDAVRARALASVFMVYMARRDEMALFPEIDKALADFKGDPMICEELLYLQRFLITSLRTKDIQRHIQDEVMPEMTKHVRNSSHKDDLEELLGKHPTPSEASIDPEKERKADELLERKQHEIMKLAREGLDINIGTFAMLRGNGFFRAPCHWFLPLDTNHPVLHPVLHSEDGRFNAIANIILYSKQLCPSDIYTFCIYLRKTTAHIEAGEMQAIAEQMGITSDEDPNERLEQSVRYKFYIQDLYRFFHLPSMRHQFCNPFTFNVCLLDLPIVASILEGTDALQNTASLMAHHLLHKQATPLLDRLLAEGTNIEHNMALLAECQLAQKQWKEASDTLERLSIIQPHEAWIHRGLELCYRKQKQDDKQLQELLWLEVQEPDNLDLVLRSVRCLLANGKEGEALKRLHRIDYEGNLEGTELLVSYYLHHSEAPKAAKILERVLQENEARPFWLLYQGCCHLLASDIPAAITAFKAYFSQATSAIHPHLLQAFDREMDEMRSQGVATAEIALVRDIVLRQG